MNEQDQAAFENWYQSYISTTTGYNNAIGTGSLPKEVWQAALSHERQRSECPQCSSTNKKRIKADGTEMLYDLCLDCGETWSDPVTTVRNELTKERQRSAKLVEALKSVYDRIAHGDDAHRAWLKAEMEKITEAALKEYYVSGEGYE